MFKRKLIRTSKESLDNTTNTNKYLKELTKKTIEECIMALNEIQDIQAIKISEEDKDKMRNSIINKKRTEFVTKIIELDDLQNQTNSK